MEYVSLVADDMDKKTQAIIKRALRKASLSNPARNKAKGAAKVAPMLFECQCGCGTLVYEGISEKNLAEFQVQFPGRIATEKGHVDHKSPVREGKDIWDWTDYIESLFCGEDNLQYLSAECHKKKSKEDKKNGPRKNC